MKQGDRIVKVAVESPGMEWPVGTYATVIGPARFEHPFTEMFSKCDLRAVSGEPHPRLKGLQEMNIYSPHWKKLDDNDPVAYDWREEMKDKPVGVT